jgi:hypothetical protein
LKDLNQDQGESSFQSKRISNASKISFNSNPKESYLNKQRNHQAETNERAYIKRPLNFQKTNTQGFKKVKSFGLRQDFYLQQKLESAKKLKLKQKPVNSSQAVGGYSLNNHQVDYL